MVVKCRHCEKEFEGEGKFCSDKCFDNHIADITRRTVEAVKNDLGHTDKFSKS